MTKRFLLLFVVSICCFEINAQSTLDNYFTGSNTFNVIGTTSDGLLNPQDLDFNPSKPNEWWVLNYEGNGGSVVIFYDPGKSTQKSEFRRDSHNGHFMIRPSAIAIGGNGTFCTTQEVQNTNSASPTFMGPALWSTDTSIFARAHQSNWDPNLPLGSHLDMLHQSPYCMGTAHDNNNAFWVFDGYNGHICKYDFKAPHVPGGDDHADGEIYRYSALTVTRKAGIPSHLALDHANSWLYIVDGGTGRILRLKTNSGNEGATLPADGGAQEPLTKYKEMVGFTSEVVVASGLTSPCGIDYADGRIIVSDNATGEIIMYDVTSMPATEVGRINTGSVGVMGVRIYWDKRIWYVNRNKRELVRIENPNVPTSIETMQNSLAFDVYPNPADDIVYVELDNENNEELSVKLFDVSGKMIRNTATRDKKIQFNLNDLPSGMYVVEVGNNEGELLRKLLVR